MAVCGDPPRTDWIVVGGRAWRNLTKKKMHIIIACTSRPNSHEQLTHITSRLPHCPKLLLEHSVWFGNVASSARSNSTRNEAACQISTPFKSPWFNTFGIWMHKPTLSKMSQLLLIHGPKWRVFPEQTVHKTESIRVIRHLQATPFTSAVRSRTLQPLFVPEPETILSSRQPHCAGHHVHHNFLSAKMDLPYPPPSDPIQVAIVLNLKQQIVQNWIAVWGTSPWPHEL